MVRVAFDSVSNLPNMLAPVIEHLLVEGVNPTTARGSIGLFNWHEVPFGNIRSV